jgi:hypothetical protein
MALTEIDIEIVKAVTQGFLTSKKSTLRKPLLIKAKSSEVLERLVRWSILGTIDQRTYFPRTLAFHYCENADALRLAKQSVGMIARVLIELFPDSSEEQWFSIEEIEMQARKTFGEIDAQQINLGLYFAPEFSQDWLAEGRNATEREKKQDWLAERIGFELTVEFHEKFRVHWRQNVDISSEP